MIFYYLKKNINKRTLWLSVVKKTKYLIHNAHVLSIINLLIKEIIKELSNKNKIEITNFGTFYLKKTNPRKYFDVVERKTKISKPKTILKFKLSKKLKKYLIEKIINEKQ